MERGGPRVESVDQFSLGILPISQREHCHAWHELIFVISGQYLVEIGDHRLEGQTGTSFAYPAGFRHRPLRCSDPARIVLVKWQHDAAISTRTLRVEDPTGRIRTGLMWLWDVFNDRPRAPRPALDGLLTAVLHQREAAPDDPGDGPVARARRYLLQNLRASISLGEVATAVGVSPSTLTRGFQAELETTPMAWRRRMRVERAMALLRDSDLDLKAIAHEVGVATPFHLSHLIRQATGRPPRAWRRRSAGSLTAGSHR
jgi:AraC-like DNA-binding protein